MCEIAHALLSEIAFEEFATPRNVSLRVLCSVAESVGAMPDIAAVMKKRAQDAKPEEPFAEHSVVRRAHATVHQPRHRQRYIEDMLNVVVRGVARVVTRIFAPVEPRKIVECV